MRISRTQKMGIAAIVAVSIAAVVFFMFSGRGQVNPVTGKAQHITLTPGQEINLGIACTPQLARDFGGLYKDRAQQKNLKRIGRRLILSSQAVKLPYQFDFHILADSQLVNIFGLPGGQIFITYGFYKILKTDQNLAAVLAHEIGHIAGRHAAEKMEGFRFLKRSDSENNVIPAEYSPDRVTKYLAKFINITFEREAEREADDLGIKYMTQAGFHTEPMLKVTKALSDDAAYLKKHR